MTYREEFERWLQTENLDLELKQELEQIRDQEKEIEDRFYQTLQFGTAGLRGIMGAGTNRMNQYMIRKVTQGLSKHILKQGEVGKQKGVVIAYDSRRNSSFFAREAGLVLAQNGIRAFVFDSIRPSPELSFAVRYLGAFAGIVITASHNPPEYNGFKLYGSDGAQIASELGRSIALEISQIPDVLGVEIADLQYAQKKGLFTWIGEHVDQAYCRNVCNLARQPKENNGDYKIVYTPLHGTGNILVRKVLTRLGFRHVYRVKEQEKPDPMFSTVHAPNPEEHQTLELAIKVAEKKGADLVIGTDPDADRVGIAVRDKLDKFIVLTGNQVGALLLDYLLRQRQQRDELPKNGVILKTIVTSEMGSAVAELYGIETQNTLTGFKYIGEKITQWEQTKEKKFLFGYEESYGYLIGDFCRDKDAVQASVLIAEMGAYYQKQGVTLYEALQNLFLRVGYFKEDLISITFTGKQGIRQIDELMDKFRADDLKVMRDIPIRLKQDYLQCIESLPRANVLKFMLQDDSWFAIRPSGTEPKLKIYFGVRGTSQADANKKLQRVKQEVVSII